MRFGLVCTDKLAQGDGSSERKSEKSCSGEHYFLQRNVVSWCSFHRRHSGFYTYYCHIPQNGGEYAGRVAQGAQLPPPLWVRQPHGKTVDIATHAGFVLRQKVEVREILSWSSESGDKERKRQG